MIDIKLVRESPKLVKDNLKRRNDPGALEMVGKIIKIDSKWRKLKGEADSLRHERNKISLQVSEAKKQGKNIKPILSRAKEISKKLQDIKEKEEGFEKEVREILLEIPNLVDKIVPEGKDERDNKEIKKWGKKPKISKPKSHLELGEALDILDLKRAAKIAGSGFYIFKNELAQMQRALINFMLDFHLKKGKIEIVSPIMANAKSAEGTAHLPKFDKDMYKTREGFYLVPTAEMTLTNIHREEDLKEEELPKRFFGYTPCFRTEAGRHGSETPGIFRLHQFDKVEMVTLCKPEDSDKEFKIMLDDAQEILKKLDIPYRVLALCSGDTGFKESITYDLETWSPYLKKYMETSSVSKVTDFQARRMNTRYRDKKENKMKFIHTLNGSGLALPRLIIAILENNQLKDGSVKIPKVLVPYMGIKKIGVK